ncbi:MAG: permease-like cell division protein FtsX [Pseudomonadota bacterium]
MVDRLRSWRGHHAHSARDSLTRLLRHPLTSLMTWLVIGIALALPVGLNVALSNARSVSVNWDSPAQISLFLRAEVSVEAADVLAKRIEQRDDVLAVRMVGREQALDEFRQLSGFGDVLANLEGNPLPNLLLVTPMSDAMGGAEMGLLRAALEGQAGVDRAVLDMEWVQRLNALVALSQRSVATLGLTLALGVLLVIGNTIRLAIENRRQEILVVKLVGGSDAFVRRPFLYTGFWYGLGGAIVAWIVVGLALWFLRGPLSALALLYQSDFALRGLGAAGSLGLLSAGAILGLLGAWLAVTRHLGEIQPR